jgi:hypothetical protein
VTDSDEENLGDFSEPPRSRLEHRDSLNDRPATATEMMQEGDHTAHDVVLDNSVNVTELLEGDHDLGDEDDALSRKFQKGGLGRRPSIDEHAPPDDEDEIARAATMAKVHRGSSTYGSGKN